MKSIFLFAAGVVSIILVSSCGNSKKTTTTGGGSEMLYQSEWKLTEVQGLFVPDASKAVLAFTQGQVNMVSGSTGCNRITGSFELLGSNIIKFSPMATTKMACLDDNANNIERKLTTALSQATGWGITDNVLELKKGETVVAKFRSQKPASAEELKLNGTWELTYISGPKIAFNGLYPEKKPTITFDFPKPEASGFSSCNGYSCKATVDGNTITFGDALQTMIFCEGGGEQLYFKTLKTITAYSIIGNELTMMVGDVAVMKFERK